MYGWEQRHDGKGNDGGSIESRSDRMQVRVSGPDIIRTLKLFVMTMDVTVGMMT
jgi:hypothetical protein